MATAINTAITANTDLNGKVEAYAEKGGIAIRQTDAAATTALTVSGSAADAILGTGRTANAATSAVASSATSTVVGDGNGEVGGADTFEGGYTLLADGDVNEIILTGGDNTGNGNLANAGLVQGTYTSGVASVNTVSKSATVATTRGAGIAGGVDTSAGVKLNATAIAGATATLSGIASVFTGNTDFTGSSGDDGVSFDLTYTDAAGTTNTATIGLTSAITNMDTLLADINDELTQSGLGVTATNNSGTLAFAATSGDGVGTISIGNVNAQYGGASSATNAASVDAVLGLNASAPGGVSSAVASGGVSTVSFVGSDTGNTATFSVAANNLTVNFQRGAAGPDTIILNSDAATMDDMVGSINSKLSTSGTTEFLSARNNDGSLEFFNSTAAGNGIAEVSADVLTVGFTTAAGIAAARTLMGGPVITTATTINSSGVASVGFVAANANFTAGAAATTSTNTAGLDVTNESNSLSFSVDGGTSEAITLTAGAGLTTDTLVTDINAQLANSTNLKGATAFNEDDKVVIRSNNTANSGSIGAIGGNAASVLGLNGANATDVGKELGVKSLMAGDLVINGVSVAAVKDSYDTASYDGANTSKKGASGIALAQAINDSTDATGVTAEVNATVTIGGDGTTSSNYVAGDSGKLHINGVDLGTVVLTGNADADRVSAVYLINEKSGQTGVTAEDNGVSVSLNAADGRNLSIVIDNMEATNTGSGIGFGAAIGLDASVAGIGEADITNNASKTAENSYETTYSTLKLNSAGVINIQGGLNGNSAIQELGFEQGEFGGAVDGQFIADLDISTIEGANLAMSAIDNALDKIGAERANLGALQNRFESTSANLQVASENLTAATSRIRDADFATETAELSRTQVLQQAGISILAQANQRPQQVLSLLG